MPWRLLASDLANQVFFRPYRKRWHTAGAFRHCVVRRASCISKVERNENCFRGPADASKASVRRVRQGERIVGRNDLRKGALPLLQLLAPGEHDWMDEQSDSLSDLQTQVALNRKCITHLALAAGAHGRAASRAWSDTPGSGLRYFVVNQQNQSVGMPVDIRRLLERSGRSFMTARTIKPPVDVPINAICSRSLSFR